MIIINTFLIFSCWCWFSARAAQTSIITGKERAYEKVERRPDLKELVQKALDRHLHKEFLKKSFNISTSGPTDKIIHKAYVKFKRFKDEWTRTIKNVCREKRIFGGEDLPIRELIDVGFSRILRAEGIDVSDIFNGRLVSTSDKISRLYSKVLGTQVELEDSDSLISSLAWLFLEYSRIYPEKKATLCEKSAEELRLVDKAFKPEFRRLVQEAIDKRLDNLVSLSAPARELSLMEESIVRIFPLHQSKSNPWPWGLVLCDLCREWNIFDTEPINVEQLIPVALSRILKAEGADINELLFERRSVSWDNSSMNVSHIFSRILDKPVNFDFYQMQSAVLWLVLRYHDAFPDKRTILLKECDEELVCRGLMEKGQLPPAGTPKRKTPDSMVKEQKEQKRRKTKPDNSSDSYSRVSSTDSMLPSFNFQHPNGASFSNINLPSLPSISISAPPRAQSSLHPNSSYNNTSNNSSQPVFYNGQRCNPLFGNGSKLPDTPGSHPTVSGSPPFYCTSKKPNYSDNAMLNLGGNNITTSISDTISTREYFPVPENPQTSTDYDIVFVLKKELKLEKLGYQLTTINTTVSSTTLALNTNNSNISISPQNVSSVSSPESLHEQASGTTLQATKIFSTNSVISQQPTSISDNSSTSTNVPQQRPPLTVIPSPPRNGPRRNTTAEAVESKIFLKFRPKQPSNNNHRKY